MKYTVGDSLLYLLYPYNGEVFHVTQLDTTYNGYAGYWTDQDGNIVYGSWYLTEWVEGEHNGEPRFSLLTEDEPALTQFSTGMVRDTASGKPRFDLVTPQDLPYERQMLYRQAVWMAKGAEHYGDRNWEKAATEEELARFKESAFRHFMKWFFDVEDGDDNAAALHFNVDGAEYVRYKMEDHSETQ